MITFGSEKNVTPILALSFAFWCTVRTGILHVAGYARRAKVTRVLRKPGENELKKM